MDIQRAYLIGDVQCVKVFLARHTALKNGEALLVMQNDVCDELLRTLKIVFNFKKLITVKYAKNIFNQFKIIIDKIYFKLFVQNQY